MQEALKVFGSNLLDRVGLIGLLRRITAARGGIVLALHRVLPLDERRDCYDPHMVLSEPAFVSLLRMLEQDYQVVSLEHLLAAPYGQEGRPKVAITFDDGWEDNYRVAFPHLLAFQMPATIFLCTGLVDTDGVLPEERFVRLWNHCLATNRLRDLLTDLRHWGLERPSQMSIRPQRHLWSQELKRMPLSGRLLLLDHFEERYSVPLVTRRRFMSWADARIMANTGLIHLGSHTSRHATLPYETDREIRRELETSRATIEQHTGISPELFAYPNGMYNQQVAELVRTAGYTAAVSTQLGTATHRTHPYAVPRIAIDDTTVTEAGTELSYSRTSVYFLSSRLRWAPYAPRA